MNAKPFLQFYVGENQFLLLSPGKADIHQMDAAAAQMLRLCAHGTTLDEHRARIDRAAGGMLPVSRLNELVQAGHLVDGRKLLASAARAATRLPSITTVAIPTADRPHLLRRCLESLVAHCGGHAESPRILVVDGSRDPANVVANREAVAATSASCPGGAIHVHAVKSPATSDAWKARGFDPELVSFAFHSGEAGGNRNLILALTRGENVLMLDDDVLCHTWEPSPAAGVTIAGHEDVCETAYFATREEALASITMTDANLLAAHRRMLGRPLAEVIPARATDISVGAPCPTMWDAIEAGALGRVVLTFAGLAGDSGISCPYQALFGDFGPGHLGDLEAGDYEIAVSSRERTRIVSRDAVTHDQHCMAFCMGVANDQLLPPFLPIGRNQDGLFGALLNICDDQAFAAYIACGIVHDPDRASVFEPGMRSASESRPSDVLIALLPAYPLGRLPTSASRMQWLGAGLRHLAELPPSRFESEVLQALLQKQSSELAAAERVINAGGGSVPYQRDVDAYRQRFLAAVAQRQLLRPAGSQRDNGTRDLQALVGRFGELLEAWPAMLECASHMSIADMAAREPAGVYTP